MNIFMRTLLVTTFVLFGFFAGSGIAAPHANDEAHWPVTESLDKPNKKFFDVRVLTSGAQFDLNPDLYFVIAK